MTGCGSGRADIFRHLPTAVGRSMSDGQVCATMFDFAMFNSVRIGVSIAAYNLSIYNLIRGCLIAHIFYTSLLKTPHSQILKDVSFYRCVCRLDEFACRDWRVVVRASAPGGGPGAGIPRGPEEAGAAVPPARVEWLKAVLSPGKYFSVPQPNIGPRPQDAAPA